MAIRELPNTVTRTYLPFVKPQPVVVVNPEPPPSQSKDPSLNDGSWRKEPFPTIEREYPLADSKYIKKLLDIL